MAGLALPSVGTFTVKVIDQVHTVSAVLTRAPTALVYIEVAEIPLPAVWTEALEGIDAIDAGTSVVTWAARTVVNILVAVCSSKTGLTRAGEVAARLADTAPVRTTNIRPDALHTPIRTVTRHGNSTAVNHLARGGLAVVLAVFTCLAFVIFKTGTVEITWQAVAQCFILTWVRLTGVRVNKSFHLTEHPCKV